MIERARKWFGATSALVGILLAGSMTTLIFDLGAAIPMMKRTRPLVTTVGPTPLDILVRAAGTPGGGDKPQCEISLEPGGGAFNVAAALVALGVDAQLIALLGDDPLSEPLFRMAHEAVPECIAAPALARTRISILLEGKCYTSRHPVVRALPAACEEEIRRADLVYVAPLMARDHEFAARILGMAKWSLLMLSADQLADRERALDLARAADLTQLNADEARQLTGEDDPVEAIPRLRSEGVANALITTKDGIIAFVEDNWIWHPSFIVGSRAVAKTGDSAAGGVLAGVALGLSWEECLRLGAAAAAFLVAEGHLPTNGLAGLSDFAERTSTRGLPSWLRGPGHAIPVRPLIKAGATAAAVAAYLLWTTVGTA